MRERYREDQRSKDYFYATLTVKWITVMITANKRWVTYIQQKLSYEPLIVEFLVIPALAETSWKTHCEIVTNCYFTLEKKVTVTICNLSMKKVKFWNLIVRKSNDFARKVSELNLIRKKKERFVTFRTTKVTILQENERVATFLQK